MHLTLTTQAIRVFHNAHIFFAVVARAEVFHSFFHLAHAGGAEAVPAAGMLHGDPVIERDLEDDIALRGFYLGYLAVLLDEGNAGQWRIENGKLGYNRTPFERMILHHYQFFILNYQFV